MNRIVMRITLFGVIILVSFAVREAFNIGFGWAFLLTVAASLLISGAVILVLWCLMGAGEMKIVAQDKKDLVEVEALMEFEKRTRDWTASQISDEQLRLAVDGLKISPSRLAALIQEGDSELTADEIKRIWDAKIVPLHDMKKTQ